MDEQKNTTENTEQRTYGDTYDHNYGSSGQQTYGSQDYQGGQQTYGSRDYQSGQYKTPHEKSDGIGFGVASLVLGIASLLLFCTFVNILTGILAIIFGVVQIASNKKKGMAIAGIVTSIVSFVLLVLICIIIVKTLILTPSSDYYFNEMPDQWNVEEDSDFTELKITLDNSTGIHVE
jgi:lysylphosphatidylglycerol synthetase-like protein (DUF2156 family)